MAGNTTTRRSASSGNVVTVTTKATAPRSTVKFGSVVVRGTRPSAQAVQANVALSSAALERVVRKLVKPGIVLRAKKDVPRFSAVEGEPGVFLRRLNGVEQRGRLVDGVFEVID